MDSWPRATDKLSTSRSGGRGPSSDQVRPSVDAKTARWDAAITPDTQNVMVNY